MHDDYLWDRSGEPDADIEGIERAVSAFRHRGTAPALPSAGETRRTTSHARAVPWAAGLIAASLIAAVMGLLIGIRHPATVWNVAVLDGRPTVDRRPVAHRGTLAVGQWLVTDAASRAVIDVGDIGTVEVAPSSRVRLVSARAADNRIQLQHGRVRAMIFAPPRQFAIESSSATAIDLGCVYTMEVGEDGDGLLHVESGWVAFAEGQRESFVPAGASARTRPDLGPGTPYLDDADPRLREALPRLDFDRASAPERAAALDAVLRAARPRDGLTLWHLLQRVDAEERIRVFERLAELVPPPSTVTRDGILRGDRDMLEAWWDQLGLEPLSWWREWERPWPPGKKDLPAR